MRSLIPSFFFVLCLCAGCNVVGGSVGVGTDSGVGVVFSSYGDFLYSGPSGAYAVNRRGLSQFLAGDYVAARELFKAILEEYPGNPDATYYLGLTLIYQDERKAGFSLLRQYRDPFKYRITQEVTWWADYMEKRPDTTPRRIHEAMNKARGEGYQRDRNEEWERRGWN